MKRLIIALTAAACLVGAAASVSTPASAQSQPPGVTDPGSPSQRGAMRRGVVNPTSREAYGRRHYGRGYYDGRRHYQHRRWHRSHRWYR